MPNIFFLQEYKVRPSKMVTHAFQMGHLCSLKKINKKFGFIAFAQNQPQSNCFNLQHYTFEQFCFFGLVKASLSLQSFSYKNLDHPVNHKLLSRVNLGWFRVTLGMFKLIQVGFWLNFFLIEASVQLRKLLARKKVFRYSKYLKNPLEYLRILRFCRFTKMQFT